MVTIAYCIGAPQASRELAERLAECGWLLKRISSVCEIGVPPSGLVMQAFCAAVRAELAEYRRLIASLDAQKHTITLRRLAVWLVCCR